ncbi:MULTISPECIES: glycosyl hydrolase family 95 catalytic domain-containing protein [unclassified Streptomyces]|uniref:glycosyl hydrolase family 95 catalytic domain-containing protein n=1 Tax=unclassified Streptomyces TaxID=2593676 RepID=UPI000DABCB9F|nr:MULTISPECIES: glycoside hydrolase N-terminal domain-containing protein [unclassified Streptomyces]PZT77730.1 hypothetical protein DNK56_31800 [Streptomyces sp. AC1-42W]PZT78319.1 hypothetical protein DNK55_00890 [Streptomyces sp. AC1-42T]
MTVRTDIDGTWEPRPAARWEDAFLAGNGRHGAMVYGDPADDRVIVNHHTLVRPNGSEHVRPPELADRLGRLQSALLAGDTTAAERFGAGRPLVWVQPFHPAFQTRLRPAPGNAAPAVADPASGYRRAVRFGTGEITAGCETWRSRVFVSRADGVIAQHVTGPGLAVDVTLDHALPGAPPRLAVGRSTVLTPDGARLTLRAGYPDSDLGYTGLTVLRAEGGRVSVAGEGVRVEGARSLLLPPRLTGLWTGDWDTAWSGAFTTNANLNLQIASAAVAALPEVSEAHAALVYGQLADWRDNARAVFGARGIVAPSHTDGESGHTRHYQRAYPLHLWTAGADWLLEPLIEHAETTGTEDPRLTSALHETALFYEDFLTRTGPDGRVAVVPSYSPENRPANASWGTVNATMDLAAARHALTASADRAPGEPASARRLALADRLADYRVNEDGALAEWAWPGLAETYDHRHLSHLYPVWPLDAINPYDTPELAAAAHRALELRGAENDSAHGHLHHALIAARLRDGARASAAVRSVLAGDFFHDSLMSAHYPGRDVYNADAAHALPAAVIESLVQSTPHRLVLLPAPLTSCPGGELRGVRTRFGAGPDLRWSADGSARAVLRPDRDARIDVRTGAGAAPCTWAVELTAGVELVLEFGPR